LPNLRRLPVQAFAALVSGLCLLVAASSAAPIAFADSQPDEKSPENIGDAWDSLLTNTIPQTTPDAALASMQTTYEASPVGDFLDHFYMDNRTEYMRTQTYFTGLPTATGVINEPAGPVANPNGIPYPPAFQSSTNEMYSFLNWGTRGWVSDRVNSNFSLAYSQDITHVSEASPQLSIIDTFNSNRRLELITGYIDIDGRPSDGMFSGTSLRLGRQDVYGAELAEMDGASFTVNRPRYSWMIYGGRRFTYFSDPAQRAMGGGNFLFRLSANSTFEYDTFYYIRGTNAFHYRQTFANGWFFSTGFRMVGSSPTDFNADAIWSPENGKTSLRLSFAQKISSKDYFYDYTEDARDFDPRNPLFRLNLEALHPHSQFIIDASRAINDRLRLGGTVWVRRLNDIQDTGPFDTSFQDYRAYGQLTPWNGLDLLFTYHLRDSDNRSKNIPPTEFDDLSNTGETKVQDLTAEIGRTFMGGRLLLRAGGFFRTLNFVDQFTVISNAHDKGVLGDAAFKLDSRSRLYFDYGLDSDYSVFRPEIQNSQTFRFGLAWSY